MTTLYVCRRLSGKSLLEEPSRSLFVEDRGKHAIYSDGRFFYVKGPSGWWSHQRRARKYVSVEFARRAIDNVELQG